MFLQVQDRDQGTLPRHGDRDRAADAAVAAGDNRDLVLEFSHARIFRHVLGPWSHAALNAGLVLLRLRRLLLLFGLLVSLFRLLMNVHDRALRNRDGNVSGSVGFRNQANSRMTASTA